MKKIRWGVLSTANIGQKKVIPAIQSSQYGEVVAICSRNLAHAQAAASTLGIARAYDSYQALLDDPNIDAIYNPLPNHLHVPWSIKALEAGKHVLCEKPLGLNAKDLQPLLATAARLPQLKVMEAFMYRFHPQWDKARALINENAIGQVRSIHSHFSYNNREADNIRNRLDMGGGALMDIGCYSISLSRYLFGTEPLRVIGQQTPYADAEVDCFISGIMEFVDGSATFTAATKMEPDQYVKVNGEAGNLLLKIPFSPANDAISELTIHRDGQAQVLHIPSADQYSNMTDAFALSIINQQPVPTPLTDALANMKIIDAIFASVKTGQWVELN